MRLVPFVLLLAAAPAFGQVDKHAKLFVETALEHGKAYALLKELCTVAPHRLAGSDGAEAAVAWGEKTMKRLGLTKVRRQKVMVPRWVRGKTEKLTQIGTGEPFKITALGGSVGTPKDGVAGEVVMVRSFLQLQKMGEAAKGKIVFFNRPMPRRLLNTFLAYRDAVSQRSSGPIETAKVGGIATIVRSATTSLDNFPHTGATNYREGLAKVPAAAVSTVDANRLAKLIKKGKVELQLQLSCKTLSDVESANVIGEIVGSKKPQEIVLIGGHLDAWDIGQGAHDDGCGICHCLEAARLIISLGLKPKRTIRVVLYMNEENGVRGAKAYANSQKGKLDLHHAAIESDRGGFRPRGFTTSARGERMQALKDLVAPLREFDMGRMIQGGGGVDIGYLNRVDPKKKVLLLGLLPEVQRYFDFHHSDRDRIENVNERELSLGAAALAYVAFSLADE